MNAAQIAQLARMTAIVTGSTWSPERRAKMMATLHAKGLGLTTATCPVCGKVFSLSPCIVRKSRKPVLCSRQCFYTARSASAKGRYRSQRGERLHRSAAEAALGRPLPAGVEVHHVDGNGNNNANQNLVICEDHTYHMLLERRTRVVKAGGNPDVDALCSTCKRPRPISDFYVRKRGRDAGDVAQPCKPCAAAKGALWRRVR